MTDGWFSFAEIRAIAAARPPGPEGDEVLDEMLDIIEGDFADRWPNAPDGVAFHFAATQVSKAMQMGPPPPGDDIGGGGRGPRPLSPRPAPEALPA